MPESHLTDSNWKYRLITEVIADYIFVVDVGADGSLHLSWASENISSETGRTAEDALTFEDWKSIIHPDDIGLLEDFIHQMLTTIEKGELQCRSFHKEGAQRWIRIFARRRSDPDGKPTHLVGAVREITEKKLLNDKLKSALEEKETLLREVHHRVKNNLQTVMTLIDIRSQQISDTTSLKIMAELQEQIRTISVIYQELFQSERLSRVSMQPYLDLLISHLLKTFHNGSHVKADVDCGETVLDAEFAMPCGLIVNELVTNALKYAFPAGFRRDLHGGIEGEAHTGETPISEPRIGVSLRSDGPVYTLEVSDNGVGLPTGLSTQNPATIGLQLVSLWARNQMNGTLAITSGPGAVFSITFTP